MGQRIGEYKNTLSQLQPPKTDQKPVATDGHVKIILREPLKPPSGWTKFKAALSHVPLLGKMGSLRQARAEMANYPVRVRDYQVQSREIMTGFVQSLREEFGHEIADMASRDLDQTGTKPLTVRNARTAIETAEHAKKRLQAENRMSLTRFMESSIQGGARMPGEKDMVGILFDRGFKMPENAGSWKDFLSESEANWVEAYIGKRVEEHPGFSTGRIPNSELAKIAGEALDLLKEFQSLGLSPEKLQSGLKSATQPGSDTKKLVADVREFGVLHGKVNHMLDGTDPQSVLCQTAQRMAKQAGLPPLSDSMLKSMGKDMTAHFGFHFHEIVTGLNCPGDVQSMEAAVKKAIEAKVDELALQHCEALNLIEQSTVLADSQKALLRNIASQRRLTPDQVRVYEQMTRKVKADLPGFQSAIQTQNAETFGKMLGSLQTMCEDCFNEMQLKGEENWEAIDFSGGKPDELMEEMVQVAFAGLKPEESRQLFEGLTKDARPMVTAFDMALDDKVGKHTVAYERLTKAVGKNAGMSSEEIHQGLLRGLEHVPLEEMSPSALLLALGTERECQCVAPTSKHKAMIQKGFSGDKCRAKNLDEWRTINQEALNEKTGLGKAFEVDLGRNNYFLNGRRISRPGNPDVETAHQAFLDAFKDKDGVVDMKLAQAVSRCCSQSGIVAPFSHMMRDALGGDLLGREKSDYEAWRNDDGSWSVRLTTTRTAEMFIAPDEHGIAREPKPLDGKGYMLGSVTYHISAESIRQGNPQIEVADSRTFFEF